MKRRFIKMVSLLNIVTVMVTMFIVFPKAVFAAGNYSIIDNFPTSVLTNWSGNPGITNLEASTTAYEGSYGMSASFIIDSTHTLSYAGKTLLNLDGSSFNGLQYRINGPGVNAEFKVKVITASGAEWSSVAAAFGRNNWKRIFIQWADFRKTSDGSYDVATPSDMASITEIRFEVNRPRGEMSPAIEGTFYLDDIKLMDNRTDDFENGISDWSGDTYSTVAGETGTGNYYPGIGNYSEGVQSMKLAYDFGSQPDGTKSTVTKAFSGTLDVREFNGISMWIKGDNSGNKLSAAFHTANGDDTYETRAVAIDFSGWKQVFFFWGQFYKDAYIVPASADKADIDRVMINITRQGAVASSDIYVDSVVFTHRTDLFSNLNLNFPGLGSVKAQVDLCDYDSAKTQLLNYMQDTRVKPSYFFNWDDKTTIMNNFNSSYPYEIDSMIDKADLAKDYDFTFEGDHRQLDPDGDNDIDWYQGNVVFTSYLSRMGWWLDSGKSYWDSYLATPDESYAAEFTANLRDFVRDSQPPVLNAGVNNTSTPNNPQNYYLANGNLWYPLVVGIRLDNWTAAYEFFSKSSSFTAEDNYLFMQSLLEQAEFIYDYEEGPHSGNHQLIECYGLYVVSLMFPEYSGATLWKTFAKDILINFMDTYVMDDGFEDEMTFGYHEWTLDQMYKAKALGDLSSDSFPPEYTAKLEKMFEVLMKMMDSKGYIPPISDSAPYYRRNYLSLGAALFNRGDFKYLSDSKINSTHFWTTPTSEINNLGNVTAEEPDFLSVKLDDTKYYYMRNQWFDGGNSLIFDGASYGTHFHADAMNIIAASDGDPLIVDPGKGNYSDFDYYPSFFVYNTHNSIQTDGLRNPVYAAPVERAWETGAEYDFVDAEVDYSAVGPTPAPYELRRKIYWAKPDYWIMNDLITPADSNSHTYEQEFHLAPSALSINSATKAVEVNDFIDNFEEASLAVYSKAGNCTITNVNTDKYEGLRSLQVDYDLNSGWYTWFRKNYHYNAQFTEGITFWIKGNSTSNIVKPFILTSSGNWVVSQPISLNYSGWKEFYIPWRLFCKETDTAFYMSPDNAANITAIDFHIYGSGTGTVYFDKVRFYHGYAISNFESTPINNFEDGSLANWAARTGTVAIDAVNYLKGAKSMKFTCNFSNSTIDYARKTQTYDASKLGGFMVAVKGTESALTLQLFAGTGAVNWRSSKTYSLNYAGWRVFYFPWRVMARETDSTIAMTNTDARNITFVEARIFKGSTIDLSPVVYLDDIAFFDSFQEKDTTETGIETWTPATGNMSLSLDASNKYEGNYSMKLTYAMGSGETEAGAAKTGTYYATNDLYGGISLRLKGNGDAGNKLKILLNNYISPDISLSDTSWSNVYIPWGDFKLANDSSISMGEPVVTGMELRVVKNSGASSGTIYVDNITFIGKEKANMTIAPVDPSSIDEINIYHGWVYYNAGRYESAPYIRYKKTNAAGNTNFNTVIIPGKKGMSPAVSVSNLAVKQNEAELTSNDALGLQITMNDDAHTYTDYYFISHNGTTDAKKYGNFYYDGSKAYIRKTDGQVTKTVKDTGSVLYESLD